MKNAIKQFIDRNELFAPEDRLLLAVSGGMDSMVMAEVLRSLGYDIALIHCNFQLRGTESDGDELFVLNWAKSHDLLAYARKFDTAAFANKEGISTQMAARSLRYAYFEEIRSSNAYDYLLTAHHLDDRLETFWLNFSRGSGWKGMSSLQAKLDHIRRPLLEVNRSRIAAYQVAQNIPFREDGSNASEVYRRNAFRHQVLPSLYAWDSSLGETAPANFRRMEQMLNIYAEAVQQTLDRLTTRVGEQQIFEYTALADHPARATYTWELLHPLGFDAEQCRQAWEAKDGSLLQSAEWQLLVQNTQWKITRRASETASKSYSWPKEKVSLTLSDGLTLHQQKNTRPSGFPASPLVAHLSCDKLEFPLSVRHWKAGDYFCPLGMKGKRQKLQDYFVNNKIDQLDRAKIWLVINGNKDIIWLVGQRIDDRYKVGEEDTEVLELQSVS